MLKKNSGKRKATDWDFFWNEYKKLLITVLPVLLGLAIMILVGYFWIGPLPPLMLSLIFFVGGFTGIIIVVRHNSCCLIHHQGHSSHRGRKCRNAFLLGLCLIYHSARVVVKTHQAYAFFAEIENKYS